MAAPATGLTQAPLRARATISGVARTQWLFGALLVGLAGAYIALFVGAALLRIGHPYPLDGTEPAVLAEIERIMRGQPLYVPPTLDYVPLIYGPVYFFVCAVAALVIGPTFTALRLVSFLTSIGSLALVYFVVQRESGSIRSGLAAAGFLAACTPLMDTVLDLGRVDALFVFLTLAAACVARLASPRGWLAPAVSGALVGLAAMAKLPTAALPAALGIGIYVVYTLHQRSLVFFAALFGTAMAIMLVLTLQSGTWATWYVVELPLKHAPGRDLIGRFWWNDLLPHGTVALVLGPLFLVGAAVRGERRTVLFLGALLSSLIAVAWASRANGGGAPNVLLPGFAALAILFGLGLQEGLRQIGTVAARGHTAFNCYVLGACVVQLAVLAYNPRTIVPLRSDLRGDDELAAALAAVRAPIFAPDYAGYLPPAERRAQPLMSAAAELWGLYGGATTPEGDQWQHELTDSLRHHRFHSIVLKIEDPLVSQVVGAGYINRGPLIPRNDDPSIWRTPTTDEPQLYVSPEP
jgi:4-amino-4-deoxy-L-arabinose transferase-like glycosyltransferase